MSDYEFGCPVFRGEARIMMDRESILSIRGFATAHSGKSNELPSDCDYSYEKKAWQHGYNCYQVRIFPWGLEVEAYGARGSQSQQLASDRAQAEFKETGKLPKEVLSILERYKR